MKKKKKVIISIVIIAFIMAACAVTYGYFTYRESKKNTIVLLSLIHI